MQNRLAPHGGSQVLASTRATLESWECAPPPPTPPTALGLPPGSLDPGDPGLAVSLHFYRVPQVFLVRSLSTEPTVPYL